MEATINKTELNCLIYLLEDQDQEIYQNVSNKLISLGAPALPDLENSVDISLDQLVSERLERIIHKIYYNKISKQMEQWLFTSKRHLLEGLILIATFQHPDLNEGWVKRKINDITQNIYFELSLAQSPLKSVSIFNHIFFDNYEMTTGHPNDHNPRYFFINHVLSFKTAEPLLISILYYLIAKQLEIPLQPVLIEGQLMLAYVKNKKQKTAPNDFGFLNKEVHFYINPANKGAILSKKELYNNHQDYQYLNPANKNAFVETCFNTKLIQLLLEKLGKCYEQNKAYEYSQELKQLAAMIG